MFTITGPFVFSGYVVSERWRTGRTLGRTIYRDNECVAVAVGPDAHANRIAREIVDALNAEALRLPSEPPPPAPVDT